MRNSTFDGLVRRAELVASRRGSLRILAASVAAGALLPRSKASAKKNNKCQTQLKLCLDTVDLFCSRATVADALAPEGPDPECVANLEPCCDLITQCQLGKTLQCVDNKLNTRR